MNLELVPTARHSTAQGEASARTLGIRHRTTLPKTGIDGYGVPVRNGISANAMISRVRHCHHDAVRFYRNAVNAVAVIMQILMADPQGCATLTLGSTVPRRWRCFPVNRRFSK